jgi:hypothetical protein
MPSPTAPRPTPGDMPATELPSWIVGLCGVAAVASLLFTALLFLNL